MPPPGLPPSLSGQPPMGASPMGMRTGQPGNAAKAISEVRAAVEILQKALAGLPIGSDAHRDVSSCISKLAKHATASESVPGVQKNTLAGMQSDQQQNAPMQQLMRVLGAQGPGASPGGQAPATPQAA